ncbi:MAG: insulinase family protein [Candidatus Berkelbacteria bacterium]|nr:insulinase family protein [Candidatus Berkelbacteria bacterium]
MLNKRVISGGFTINFLVLPQKTEEIFLRFVFDAGYSFSPKDKFHLPHLLEHLIANKLNPFNLKYYYAEVDLERIEIGITFKNLKEATAFEKIFEVIFNFETTEKAVAFEQKIIYNELQEKQASTVSHLFDLALNNRFQTESNYTHDPRNLDEIKSITKYDLEQFHHRYFTPQNCTIFVGSYHLPSGDMDEAIKMLSRLKFTKGDSQEVPSPGEFSNFGISQESRGDINAFLGLNWPIESTANSMLHRHYLCVITDLLTWGPHSLLYSELREKRGLVYGIQATSDHYQKFSFVGINTFAEPTDINIIIKIILDQICNLKTGKIDSKRFHEILESYIENDTRDWKNNYERFDWNISNILTYGKVYSLNDYIKICKQTKETDVTNYAKKIFDNSKLNINLVGKNLPKITLNF